VLRNDDHWFIDGSGRFMGGSRAAKAADACTTATSLAASCRRRYKPPQSMPPHLRFSENFHGVERTFSIIKPMRRRVISPADQCDDRAGGLRIIAQSAVRNLARAGGTFYAVHRQRPFFGRTGRLHDFGSRGDPGARSENAIVRYRDIMARRSGEGCARTIRKVHAKSIGENSSTFGCAGHRGQGNRQFSRQ